MDLETLQVIFDINTAKVQPKLDALQKKFANVFSHFGGSDDGQKEMTDKLNDLTDTTKGVMDKLNDVMQGSSEKAAKAMTSNMSKMKTDTTKIVDSMVRDIDAKMDQARAAQERMVNLKGMRATVLDSGDNKTAGRLDEQIASAQARMTRFQNQAKALAQELNDEASAIPGTLKRIASAMDENEVKIEGIRQKIKGLEVAEKDAMQLDPSKGFDAEPTVPTKASKAIADQISKERSAMDKLIGTSDSLNSEYGRLEDRSKALGSVTDGLDTDLTKTSTRTRTLRESFATLSNEFSTVGSRVSRVMSAFGKVTGISRMRSALAGIKDESGGVLSKLTELGSRGSSSMNKMGNSAKHTRSQLSELSYGIKSLPSQFLIWGVGFEAMMKFSQTMSNAIKTDREFNNSLNQIKANLITAFYPLYSTIMPWIDDFMNMLAKATGWLAQFSAALFGMSNSSARAGAANLYKQTKAMGETSIATSKATKEIQKQNAAITAHNRAMSAEISKENQQITAQNTVRRKAIQEQNQQIKDQNAKRKQAVEDANAAITASNKKASQEVAKENDAQKKRIAELKKKYDDYKNSLMGFDEINTLGVSKDIPDYTPKKAKQKVLETYKPIATKSTDFTAKPLKHYTPEATKSTAGLDGYTPDGVDDALNNPVNAFSGATDAAKKFKQVLADLFKPIKEAWDKYGAGVIKEFKYALGEINRLLDDIGKSFMHVWDSKLGVEVVSDILKLLKTVLGIIGDIAKAFVEAWEDHGAGTKYIKSIFEAFDSILKTLNAIGVSFRKAWDGGDTGKKITSDLLKLFTDINKMIKEFSDSFRAVWKEGDTGTKLFSAWLKVFDNIVKLVDEFVKSFTDAWKQGKVGQGIFNDIFKIATNVGKTIGALAGQFDKAWKSGKTGQSIFHTILGAAKDVLDDIKDMSGATVTFAKNLDFTPLLKSIESLFKSLKGLNKTVWDALDWGYKNVLMPLAKFTITQALPAFFKVLAAAIKVVNSVLKALAPLFKSLFDTFLKPFASYTGGKGISALNLITKALDKLSSWIDKHQSTVRDFAKVLGTLFVIKIGTSAFTQGIGFMGSILDELSLMKVKGPILKQLFNKITGLDKLKNAFSTLKNITGLSWDGFKGGAGKAKDLAGTTWSKLKDGAKYAGDLVSVGWSKLKDGAVTVVGLVKDFKNWSIWGKLAAGAQAALNAVMAVNPYVLLAAAIAAVIAGFVLLYKHNKKFRDFVHGVYKSIVSWLGDAITWLKKNWADVALFIINPVGGISNWFLKDTKTGKAIVKWGQKQLKHAVKWAQSIGKGINEKVEIGKKWATQAGGKIGKWVNRFRAKASKTIKSWASKLGSKVHDGVDGAKKLASAAGTKIGGWVNGFRKKASSTLKKWSKGLGSTIHSGISGAKSLATKAGESLGSWVGSFRSKASSTIGKWAGSLGSTISKGLKGTVNTIKAAAGDIANGIVSTIGAAVNGVIKGLKWILQKVGANGMANNLSTWNIPKFAAGGVHQGGLAMVNDEDRDNYQESYLLPNGQQGIFPKQRNIVTMMPYGTKIKSAAQTEREIYDQIPHYANGVSGTTWSLGLPTGSGNYSIKFGPVLSQFANSVMDEVQDSLKGIRGGNVLYDANHPLDIIKEFTSAADNVSSNNSLGNSLGRSGVSMVRDGAVSEIGSALRSFANKQLEKMHKIIDDATDAYNRALNALKAMMKKLSGKRGHELGGTVTQEGNYPLAEGNRAEMIVPLTKPQLAMSRINEALNFMGYNGTGVTMPGAMTTTSLPTTSALSVDGNKASTQVKGNGVSGMQEAIVNAVMMGLQQQKSSSIANADQPIEITVKIGDESFGKHAIKGINSVNKKNGKNMLKL
ncbi:hypothetical protein [Levilactobacillus brevis]|uniref:hypothetical protein n=1 Tax=Levilactobacillus brevis TaxID=1580 RepID=UPI001BA813B0|nr:hypothetical protein [Levilactobacillus brevis]MBS0978669.1 hypothetical protein [Levilactobacillus brevis]